MSSFAGISHASHSPIPTAVDRSTDDGRKLVAKILVRNLSFYYGDNRALNSINVPLYDRKVTAFIGPSGCGKSTLLRILNRIYSLYPHQRAEGEVLLDGANILGPGQDLNLLRARVGMVFQKPTPFPMSIYENIAFGVRLFEKLPRAEIDERVESALRRAAIWEEVKDKLHANGLSLSGANSSGCASPAPWRSGLKSFCWTSRVPRLTRFPLQKSRN